MTRNWQISAITAIILGVFIALPPASAEEPSPSDADQDPLDQLLEDALSEQPPEAPRSADEMTVERTIPVEPQQEPATAPRTSAARSRMVEEILVTAQKREERMQDVPVAVSAFSAEKLDAAGIESTRDLQILTPGLVIAGSSGFNLIYLRGIGTSAFIPSFDPSVATYVDGMYIPSQQATLTDLGGVERVEILKGPQGTLFGRNSTGGAINVVTRSPGDMQELSIRLEGGSFRARKASLHANYPITRTLFASVSGIFATEDSYYDVVEDPQSPAQPPDYSLRPERTRGGRIKLRWMPTDRLDLQLTGYHIRQDGSIAFVEANVEPSPLLGSLPLLAIRPAGDFKTNANTEPASNSKTTAIYGNAVWSLPWMDVKLIAGNLSQDSFDLSNDFDGGQADLVTFTAPSSPSDLRTAELQFVSNNEGWTPDWLEWIGGLYYLHQEAGYDPFIAFIGSTGLLPDIPLFDFDFGPVGLISQGVLETKSYSAFLQGTTQLARWLGVTLGGRYQTEDRELIKQSVSATVLGSPPIPLFQFQQPKVNQSNFSHRASLDLTPTDGMLLYLSWARSFKSGSYNIVTLYTVPDWVDPERVTTWELGAKTRFGNGLTLNAAIFHNDIENLQETKLSLLSGGAISAENAGSARTRGAEFDLLLLPFPSWNPGLVITAGAAYIDAVYIDYVNGSGFDEDTGLPFGRGSPLPGRDFTGNRIARTPKYSGTVTLSQTIKTRWGPFEIGGDYYYNDGFNFTPQNSASTEQASYSLISARLSFLYERHNLRLTVFGRNLTDETYAISNLLIDFGNFQTLAKPRTFGLSLSYDY